MEEYQSLHLLQSSVTPWTRDFPELPLGCERSLHLQRSKSAKKSLKTPCYIFDVTSSTTAGNDTELNRDSPSPTEKAVSTLNTVRSCHPPHDSWAKMHIASLQYITQKGREKAKFRVIELLQGHAFSDESETEEDNEPEV